MQAKPVTVCAPILSTRSVRMCCAAQLGLGAAGGMELATGEPRIAQIGTTSGSCSRAARNRVTRVMPAVTWSDLLLMHDPRVLISGVIGGMGQRQVRVCEAVSVFRS